METALSWCACCKTECNQRLDAKLTQESKAALSELAHSKRVERVTLMIRPASILLTTHGIYTGYSA